METLSSRRVSHFELLGTHAANMVVAPCFIVEAINIVGHVGGRQCAILVDLFLDPLFLETAEERLDNEIIPTVMKAEVARTRPVRGFVDIGIALRCGCYLSTESWEIHA